MKLAVDRIVGSDDLTREDLKNLQSFREGYPRYLKLALRAVEKLDWEQIFDYFQGARLAIGSSA